MDTERREEIIQAVLTWLAEQRLKDETVYNQFVNGAFSSLSRYHPTLGRYIRNEFGLWKHEWTPREVKGVDYSEDHPDAISMSIIEEVWLRANEEKQ